MILRNINPLVESSTKKWAPTIGNYFRNTHKRDKNCTFYLCNTNFIHRNTTELQTSIVMLIVTSYFVKSLYFYGLICEKLKGMIMLFKIYVCKIFLSLCLPCEIFCFKPVFGACSYAVSHFESLQANTEKLQLDLNGPFSVCAHMYVMIQNGKLHTSKHQKQV